MPPEEATLVTIPSHSEPSPQLRIFTFAVLALAVCFALPLYRLVRFSLGNELFSYIPLMPFVTWYLIRLKRNNLPAASKPFYALGAVFLVGAAALLAWSFTIVSLDSSGGMENYLSATVMALVLAVMGVAALTLGKATFRELAFPLGMLIFMVPMPVAMVDWVEKFLEYKSAMVVDGMFWMSGMDYLRKGLVFDLPTISLMVAPECSGIHSTWILFITSLLAGYLFLRSPWRRLALTLAVLPLALIRNGFRIFTIGELCVHIGPHMIDSWIHHHGGPFFFALSMIPFMMLLAWLHLSERKTKKSPVPV
jgi:exosortase C (VPDSG-CTERM-specific)